MQSETPNNEFATEGSSGTDASRPANAELEAQVAKLRTDLAGVAEALKAMANERADGAKRQAYALRDDVRDRGERYVQQAQDAVSELEDQVAERVRAEPIKAVAIAAAIGYLYARIFR
jgi:ElaB/YqjD/DUF883 family membrane-anchored ribosome-binding protein